MGGLFIKNQKTDRKICYKDQQIFFMKGEASITSMDNGTVSINHVDERLNKLIQNLKKKKNKMKCFAMMNEEITDEVLSIPLQKLPCYC